MMAKPTHPANLGDTYRDAQGRLWIYRSDNVASCYWARGFVWSWFRERHNLARAKSGV